ncbi:WD40 repeat domain-containing protein [Amycolatopsis aidingensis]|uniref:WD40 repeat domain-containing protein n=1 Tax=Amycolatopsis aidingensis TaxID=2842453 RepID=UPI001C0B5CE7|nr:WD40 repeat domain-containing protein [Amycolatopsis aidingensis]
MTEQEAGRRAREVFAERFALLYAEAGDPTLRRVTEAVARVNRRDERGSPVRVSAQRISDWRRGRNVPARFPPLAIVLEILIGEARKLRRRPVARGLYELAEWRRLWEDALRTPAEDQEAVAGAEGEPEPDPEDTGVCPYRGLAAFRPEDADRFFGRERSTTALLEKLEHALGTGGMVVLVGASGAGKSSLLRAGLVPAMEQEELTGGARLPVAAMSPGANPLKELSRLIPELATELEDSAAEPDPERTGGLPGMVRTAVAACARRLGGPGATLAIVVDQFEELFTLGADKRAQRLFVQALHAACTPAAEEDAPPGLVVLGVRADFYGRCLDYPELAEALQERQLVLGAMATGELREAVSRPAKSVGLQLEPGLVDLMLRDLGLGAGREAGGQRRTYEAGALPLLSHALLATWQRRQAGRLTIAGYRAAGGIHGAVAATAERAWADLSPAAQAAARPLLLRLVHVGEDTQDTRRRATRADLVEHAGNRAAAEAVLEALVKARLVTLDSDSAEISHEALLHAWPRLREWIDQDRAGNVARQRLETDALAWAEQDRDSSLLYRGNRLETARQAARRGSTGLAREFLDTSNRHARRSAWLRRAAVVTVALFAVATAVAAGVAIQERDDARFGQVVAEADRLTTRDPSVSAQFDLLAHRLRPEDTGVAARVLSTQHRPLAIPLTGHQGAVYLTTFGPDGRTLATAGYDGTVRLWDVSDRDHPKPLGDPLTGHTSWVSSAVFSPDGDTLVTAGHDGTLRLWDVSDPAAPMRLGEPLPGGGGTIYLTSFSPDGRVLATANDDGAVRLWDLADPAAPSLLGAPLTAPSAAVRSVDFSPDGSTLAGVGNDGAVRLWDLTGQRPALAAEYPGAHPGGVHSVAFSPDGSKLATGGEDDTVRLWDISTPGRLAPLGHPMAAHKELVWSVAFSPDGRVLASGSKDGTVRLWNISDPARPGLIGDALTGHTGAVYAVGFSPDGRTLASGGDDGVLRLWSLPPGVLIAHSASVSAVSWSPQGRTLASGGDDGTVQLWDVSDPAAPAALGPRITGEVAVNRVLFSPAGGVLAVGRNDDTVRLWDVSDPGRPVPLGAAFTGAAGGPMTFSPDGRTLATANDTTIQLWDVTDPAHPSSLATAPSPHAGYLPTMAFSPDGRMLATGSFDHTVRLWDVGDPTAPAPIGQPITGHGGPVWSVAFGPDGDRLATASGDRTIRLWDIGDPAAVHPVGEPITGHTDAVSEVAFRSGRAGLVSTGMDGTVRLWDLGENGAVRLQRTLTGHTSAVLSIAGGPGGKFLATGGRDNTARVWRLDMEQAIQRICTDSRGSLTEQVWREYLPQLDYRPPCE